ncbi:MAG: hypothetical protein JNG85_05335 [Spirochaetaceae bacterium]|nr:hypothetical protein [Spirochaetaceae bacterium]
MLTAFAAPLAGSEPAATAVPGLFGRRLTAELGGFSLQSTRPGLAIGGATAPVFGPVALAGRFRFDTVYSYAAFLGVEAASPSAAVLGGRLAAIGGLGLHCGFGRVASNWVYSPAPQVSAAVCFERGGAGLAASLEARFWSDAAELAPRLSLFADARSFTLFTGLEWSNLLRRDGARSGADIYLFSGVAFRAR